MTVACSVLPNTEPPPLHKKEVWFKEIITIIIKLYLFIKNFYCQSMYFIHFQLFSQAVGVKKP